MNAVLKLDQAKRISATADDLVDWQSRLRAACINSISPEDMQEIVQAQLAKAKAGDHRALAFISTLIGAKQNVTVNNILCTDVETAGRLANKGAKRA